MEVVNEIFIHFVINSEQAAFGSKNRRSAKAQNGGNYVFFYS